ncbi:2-ketoarginine methyltransferase [Paenibacillus sp. SC116]|uniref:2-ketoarginine methyltransferase n=1 Tax=Paenibacillus sp. SC116 TaxID=2968986 RepID=UPI00215AE575|nr:2-ketoarginine methyltransferase [Paenibacillus sp. SC116]MCR8844953.1 2-ketoarginine methyltransferase [Paenibacillus sp. SC116]
MFNGALEGRLIEATHPIRQHVLAVALYHLFDTGLFDALNGVEPTTAAQCAEHLRMDESKLTGFFKYLKVEGIIEEQGETYMLTSKGQEYSDFRAWYIMLIGGYANTFFQIGEKLYQNSGWATRDAMKVGVGSCGISHYDAIPLTSSLMKQVENGCSKLLDLGCGNGMYLVEFCKQFPSIEAWGTEPSVGGYQEAKRLIQESGLAERVRISNFGAIEFFEQDIDYEPDFIVLGFVLHEILGQEGEDGVIQFLNTVTTRYPDINMIIIEVDNRIDDPAIMRHGLSLAYYNPYYLLHYFTEQKLETESYWDNLFDRCGLEIVAKESTDPNIDSTGLEIGYLLKKRG